MKIGGRGGNLFDVEEGGDFSLEVPCFAFVKGDGTFVLDGGGAHGDDGAFYAFGGLDDTGVGTGDGLCGHDCFCVERFLYRDC